MKAMIGPAFGMMSEWRCGRRARSYVTAAIVAVIAISLGTIIYAASLSETATATATVGALAKLTLSAATLAFPDADPDTVPDIPASGGPLTITAKVRTTIGSTVMLVVQASDDLRSGLDLIPASQLRWSAGGTGFVPGTMSRTTAQTVASWVSSGAWTGTQTYTLVNAWNYATGTYSTTLTYTLTAP
jgi:hypothetical protein